MANMGAHSGIAADFYGPPDAFHLGIERTDDTVVIQKKLPLFFKWASIIAVVQYGTLLLAGYFLGTSFGGTAEKVIKNVQYIVAIATIAITAYYIVSWRARQKFLKERQEGIDISR